LRRPSNKHEVPSNPIRCARAHSVPKTACLARRIRYSFEYRPFCGRKAGSPIYFITQCAFGESPREPLAFRVARRRHRQGCERRTPSYRRARSSRIIACARVLGLRTHAQTFFRTAARLPAWEILAFPKRRDIGVGRLSLRGTACRLTCGLH
jgi:hypothetical protein